MNRNIDTYWTELNKQLIWIEQNNDTSLWSCFSWNMLVYLYE